MKLDRAFVTKNIPAFINVFACYGFFIFFLIWPIGNAPGSSDLARLIATIAAMIGTLTIAQIMRSAEMEEEKNLLQDVKTKTDRMISLEGDVRLAKNPKGGANEYSVVWGGFTQTYRAYNPAYKIEGAGGFVNPENREQLFESVFRRRYEESDACALYLFFTHDGDQNLRYFKELMREFKAHCEKRHRVIPNLSEKIRVRQSSKKIAANHPEMYIGNQHGKPTVVYELREPRAGHGDPKYYGLICSEPFHGVCVTEFDRDWEEAGTQGEVDIWAV